MLNSNQRDTLDAATAAVDKAAKELIEAADQTLARIAGIAADKSGATALIVEMSFIEGTYAQITAVGGGPPRPLYEIDEDLYRAAEHAATLHAQATAELHWGERCTEPRTITPAP